MAPAFFWTLMGFLLGSLPFSVWLGRLFLRRGIRRFGDGNPGGVNAWKAGGWPIGLLAMLLDAGKGLVPVLLARATGAAGESEHPFGAASHPCHHLPVRWRRRSSRAAHASQQRWGAPNHSIAACLSRGLARVLHHHRTAHAVSQTGN
jgi:glycerol-3-phosphate acyltransferase PlsY